MANNKLNHVGKDPEKKKFDSVSEGSKKDNMREALRKQRAKELKKEKNKKITIVAIIVLVVIAIGAGIVWAVSQSSSGTSELGEQLTPSKVDANGAFHVSKGGAVIDDVKPTGQTRVDMFFDPMCPGCGLVDRAIGERTNELLANDEIDLYLTPVAFLDNASSDNYSTRAVNATITVAEESPEHYYDFVNNIYEVGHQPSEGQAYVPVTDALLAERAVEVGVPQEVADKFKAGHYTDWVKENTSKQLNDRNDLFPDGFSTPAVFLNVKYEDTETNSGKVKDFTRVEFNSSEMLDIFNNALETAKAAEVDG